MRSLVNQPRSPPSPDGSLESFGRHLGEVLACLDASERGLRLVLGRQQDVAGVDFLLRRLRLGGLVIGLALRLLGRRRLGDGAEQLLHRQLVAIVGELAFELRGGGQLVGLGLLGGELEVDEIVEHVFLPRRAFELLRQAGADVGHRVGDVVLGDRRAVDLRQHLRIGREPGRRERKPRRARARTRERSASAGKTGSSFGNLLWAVGTPFAGDFVLLEAAIEGFGRHCEGKEGPSRVKNAARSPFPWPPVFPADAPPRRHCRARDAAEPPFFP